MATSTVASVHELAAELLAKCEAVLGTTVGGIPPSTFLSPGLPALDRQCDTLCVYETEPTLIAAAESTAPGSNVQFAGVTYIGLSVQVARCMPTGRTVLKVYQPPTDAELTLAAVKVMEDGWALWNGIVSELKDADLFEGYPCRAVEYVALTPLDPQGGMAGWTLAIAVELQGYDVAV